MLTIIQRESVGLRNSFFNLNFENCQVPVTHPVQVSSLKMPVDMSEELTHSNHEICWKKQKCFNNCL